ncbi:MAG: hypothetical protein AAFX93_20005 [Verrucomicrobiota bacterium]
MNPINLDFLDIQNRATIDFQRMAKRAFINSHRLPCMALVDQVAKYLM